MNVIRALQDQVWAIEPRSLSSFIASVDGLDLQARADSDSSKRRYVEQVDGCAVIQFRGPVLRGFGWLADFGVAVADPDIISAQIKAALSSESIKEIVIEFDSPGGVVGGVADLADLVASAQKPINANIDGLCCSAAYWVASGADTVVVNQTSMVGGVGVFVTAYDFSKMFENDGIKTHVVASHSLKGAGAPGSEITKEQIEDISRNVKTLAGIFGSAVERGRGLSGPALAGVSTGQVWIGKEAVDVGLADRVAIVATETAGQKTKVRASAEEEGVDMPELEERVSALESKCADLEERVKQLESSGDESSAAGPEKRKEEDTALALAGKALRASLFAQHEDKLTPALRASLASVDPTELEPVLEALPAQAVRTQPEGDSSVQQDVNEADEDQDLKKAQSFFGVSAASMQKAGEHASLTMPVVYPDKFGGA